MADNQTTQLGFMALMRTMGDSKIAADKPLFTDDAITELAGVLADTWDALTPHHRYVLLGVGGLIAAQQMRELEAQDLASGMLDQIMGRDHHG